MKKFVLGIFVMLLCVDIHAVTVTITTDESFNNSAIIDKMQRNLGSVLTEINNAYRAKRNINTVGLEMDDHAKNMLVTLWATVRFYCDDEEVVDRCWP